MRHGSLAAAAAAAFALGCGDDTITPASSSESASSGAAMTGGYGGEAGAAGGGSGGEAGSGGTGGAAPPPACDPTSLDPAGPTWVADVDPAASAILRASACAVRIAEVPGPSLHTLLVYADPRRGAVTIAEDAFLFALGDAQ